MVWNIGNHWDRGVPVMIGESRYRLGDSCGQGWSCFLRKISSTCEIKSATTSPTVAAETSTKAKAVPLASVLVYNFRSRDTAMSLDTVCQPHGAYTHGRCLCDVGFLPRCVCVFVCMPLCIPTSLHTSHHPFQFSPPPLSLSFSRSLSLSLSFSLPSHRRSVSTHARHTVRVQRIHSANRSPPFSVKTSTFG
jgi:hypothetical protein